MADAVGSKARSWTRRNRTLVIVAVGFLVVAAIAGFAIYRDRVAPFRTTVLIVNDATIDMRYFLTRSLMSGQEPLAVLRTLSFEEIVRQTAPNPPYNIDVTEDDIDRKIRDTARGESDSISDEEFAEWYRQRLNDSRLSDSEARELTRTRLLRARLTAYLADRVPTVDEQVHLYAITQGDLDDANAVTARLDAGEDFFELARELNVDESLKANGGEIGWFARGTLAPNLARIAFDDLDVGEASEPLILDGGVFAIFMVSERADAREIDDDVLQTIKGRAFDDWISAEFGNHGVEYHGFSNGYDSDTDAWVKRQLREMRGESR